MAHNADALHCSLPVRVVLFTRMFTPKKPQKPKLLAGSNKARAKHAECGCVDGSNNHGMAWCMAWYPTKLNWTERSWSKRTIPNHAACSSGQGARFDN